MCQVGCPHKTVLGRKLTPDVGILPVSTPPVDPCFCMLKRPRDQMGQQTQFAWYDFSQTDTSYQKWLIITDHWFV